MIDLPANESIATLVDIGQLRVPNLGNPSVGQFITRQYFNINSSHEQNKNLFSTTF